MMRRRRLLVPEVVQTSNMDCGPAALKSLLGGLGIEVGYDRLREACQTDVDGTSIDTLEEVAVQLGAAAEQIMLPPDHLFIPEARAFPAVLVVTNALGMTHFVVVWRQHGSWVQVMDPSAGRRWLHREELRRTLYVHSLAVPAAAWRDWAGSADFVDVLEARMAALGLRDAARRTLIAAATAEPDWRPLAALDAAVRMSASVARSGGVARGRSASALVEALFEETLAEDPEAEGNDEGDKAVPELYWSVLEAPPADGEPRLSLRGAVLMRVRGSATAATGDTADTTAPLSPELAAALAEPPWRPSRELLKLLTADGVLKPFLWCGAVVAASVTTLTEAILFRGLLDVGLDLAVPEQRLAAAAALGLFLAGVVVLEVPIFAGLLRLGRRLEIDLRMRFLEKTARLAQRYFRSRLSSDMAERCHSVDKLREVPILGADLLRIVSQIVLTGAGIVWLDPRALPAASIAVAVALVLPLLALGPLTERDLRVRQHAGAASRFYLDGLLGLVPARYHAAERALRREHEGLLLEWTRAMLRREWVRLLVDLLQAGTGYGLAVWILVRNLGAEGDNGGVLLLAYWALQLQMLGQRLTMLGQRYPQYRNITLRLLEPFRIHAGEPLEPVGDAPGLAGGPGGVDLRFESVRVVVAGHGILEDVDQVIEPGSHVAIVGPSGAGKSTFVGLLLGWHEASGGRVLIDGTPLDAALLPALRRATAWVDPSVRLWNRSLLDNVRYGSGTENAAALGSAVDAALLRETLPRLSEGMLTALGEGGALVSGGEGQRVRLARALLRPDARLVILDEPFRGLDRSQRRALTRRARQWWPRATLFYVSHDIEETLSFDRVLVIEEGRITEAGRPQELAAAPPSRYAALLDAEAQAREALAEGPVWRRTTLVEGRLVEGRLTEPGR